MKSLAHNVPLVLVINRRADSKGVMPCYRIRAQNPARCTRGCALLSAIKQKMISISFKLDSRSSFSSALFFLFLFMRRETEKAKEGKWL